MLFNDLCAQRLFNSKRSKFSVVGDYINITNMAIR